MCFDLVLICVPVYRELKTGNHEDCSSGEKITTYRDISDATGISLGFVGRLLNALKEQGLIDIIRVPGGSKIKLLAYGSFGIPATKKQE